MIILQPLHASMQWGYKSKECDNLPTQIWEWCIAQDIWLTCHIPGSQNVEADTESRVLYPLTEWSFSLPVFADTARRWGSFDIDYLLPDLTTNYLVMPLGDQTPMPSLSMLFIWIGTILILCFSTFQCNSNMFPKNNS